MIVLYEILEAVQAVHFDRPDPRLGRLCERLRREIRQSETLAATEAARLESGDCPQCGRNPTKHETPHGAYTRGTRGLPFNVCPACGLTDVRKRRGR